MNYCNCAWDDVSTSGTCQRCGCPAYGGLSRNPKRWSTDLREGHLEDWVEGSFYEGFVVAATKLEVWARASGFFGGPIAKICNLIPEKRRKSK